jgi:hypothetical protein
MFVHAISRSHDATRGKLASNMARGFDELSEKRPCESARRRNRDLGHLARETRAIACIPPTL